MLSENNPFKQENRCQCDSLDLVSKTSWAHAIEEKSCHNDVAYPRNANAIELLNSIIDETEQLSTTRPLTDIEQQLLPGCEFLIEFQGLKTKKGISISLNYVSKLIEAFCFSKDETNHIKLYRLYFITKELINKHGFDEVRPLISFKEILNYTYRFFKENLPEGSYSINLINFYIGDDPVLLSYLPAPLILHEIIRDELPLYSSYRQVKIKRRQQAIEKLAPQEQANPDIIKALQDLRKDVEALKETITKIEDKTYIINVNEHLVIRSVKILSF